MPKVNVSCDDHEVTDELDRLIKGPDFRTIGEFESTMLGVLGEIEAIVHIETGSLKSTGRLETSYVGYAWAGTIHYGGAAPGMINDPVYYGVYELARGGTHFFFAPAYDEVPEAIIDGILEFMAGGSSHGMDVSGVAKSAAQELEAALAGGATLKQAANARAKKRIKDAAEKDGKPKAATPLKTTRHVPKKKADPFLSKYLGG
jgi:hypothetical protein